MGLRNNSLTLEPADLYCDLYPRAISHGSVNLTPVELAPRQSNLTDIVEGTAGGWRDLEKSWVNERSEGGRRLVLLHVVTRLALQRRSFVKV